MVSLSGKGFTQHPAAEQGAHLLYPALLTGTLKQFCHKRRIYGRVRMLERIITGGFGFVKTAYPVVLHKALAADKCP